MMGRIFPVRGYILFIKAKQHKFPTSTQKKEEKHLSFPSKGIVKI
jgi:hypothetical protein